MNCKMILLCLFSCLLLTAPAHLVKAEEVHVWTLEELEQANTVFTGDFGKMKERRIIRVLMPYSKTFYFFEGAQPRGASYELVQQFEEFINKKLKSGTLKVQVIVLPTAREDLIPEIRDGKGDIGVGNLTITENRLKHVDFSDPLASGISEILVTGIKSPDFKTVFDLSGRKVFARKSSSYYQSLLRLNETLKQTGKKEVIIKEADDHLEDEDLLEMVNGGLIDNIVIDSHKAEFWAEIFDGIKLHPNIKLRTEGRIGWIFRKNSPELEAIVNEFIKDHKLGTLMGNILYKRYLKNTDYITDSIYNEDLQRFKITTKFFQKYGDQYGFDYLMLAALGYQESRLDQSLKSSRGAVGIMQILPSTAKDKNIGIPDINKAEANIHAGTKYLSYMNSRYFANDPNIDSLNKTLFTFASYNAGPAKISQLRREAEKMGLNPNIWFNNVEVVAARKIGRETVQYVSNIFKYYVAYTLVSEKMLTDEPINLSDSSKKKKAGK